MQATAPRSTTVPTAIPIFPISDNPPPSFSSAAATIADIVAEADGDTVGVGVGVAVGELLGVPMINSQRGRGVTEGVCDLDGVCVLVALTDPEALPDPLADLDGVCVLVALTDPEALADPLADLDGVGVAVAVAVSV
jgi:hypothetical protein